METSMEREIYQSRSSPAESFVLKDYIFLQNKEQFRNSQDVTDFFFSFQSWRWFWETLRGYLQTKTEGPTKTPSASEASSFPQEH